MTPAPNLQELIDTVRADAASDDPLDQLATASQTAAEVEETTDAMLSHFVDQCRHRGRSWTEISKALGVSKQAAHKRFSPAQLLDRFTIRARAAVDAAHEAATSLGHPYAGTEHLLLGLFHDPEALAAKALANAGVTRAQVEEKILATTPRGTGSPTATPLTPRAATALGRALDEALTMGHNYVGTEHMLLALFTDEDSLAAKVLADLHIDRDKVRTDLVKMLSGLMNKRSKSGS
jgi:hypothetical protein